MLDFLFTYYRGWLRHDDMWEVWDLKISSSFPVPELRGRYFDYCNIYLSTGTLELFNGPITTNTKVFKFDIHLTTEG